MGIPLERVLSIVRRLEEQRHALGVLWREQQAVVLALVVGVKLEVGVAQVVHLLHASQLGTPELYNG